MGKATGQSKNLRGKIGQMIYYQRKDGTTVVYEAKEKAATPVRTEAQMQIRTQWSNLGAVYTQFHKTLKKGFEGLEAGLSDYNAFIQANVGVCKVYIPKWIRLNGGCVLAPYLVTRGKMPSISMTRSGGDVLVSNIALGALVIGDDTTVGELSAAVLAYNATWQEGDQLTFFYGTQEVDEVTGTPRALISGWKVVLDVTDETVLWNVVSPTGFSSVDGRLGMGVAISSAAAVWVHTREGAGSDVQVSTQYLYVDSAILESYQNEAAFAASAASYGGINTEEAFLDPRSTGRRAGASGAGSGSGSGGSSAGGSEQGGSGSSDPVTPVTVAAPQFSGETQFTESTQVTMSGPAGASIFYTVDGSTPTDQSLEYEEPITLSATTTVKAIAIKDGVSSSVTSRTYTKSAGGGDDEPGGDDH